MSRACEKEFRTGHKLIEALKTKYATAEQRERLCAEHAKELRGHKSLKSLGKCVFTQPAWEWFRQVHERGIEEVQSPEYIRHQQKTHPELAPNKI